MSELLTIGTALIALAIGVLSLGAAYRALLTSRTPQGAVGWILLILLLPILGTLVYFVFGHANYKRFEQDRQRSDNALFEHPLPEQVTADRDARLMPFARIARLSVTTGNDMELMIDGPSTFEALNVAIGTAQTRVMAQFYTIKDDEIGRAFRDALVERAEAGVEVYLLHDELPFVGLSRKFKKSLTDAGVRLARTKGPSRLLGPFQLNFRNHRKLVVVDDQVAFTGGFNVSETYIGRSSIGAWRDTFARFTGPIVNQLTLHFISDWRWATEELLEPTKVTRDAQAPAAGLLNALSLAPSPAEDIAVGNLYFIALAHAAKTRLWIATPYFVPDRDVLTALRFAALRGVDVKVIVPERGDHYLTYFAAMAYFDDLRSVGAEVWTYGPAFLHHKVALVDDDLTSIGSINLDIRSGLLNFEITVVTEGESAARDVEKMLKDDMVNAKRVDIDLDDRSIVISTLARIARLFAPVL